MTYGAYGEPTEECPYCKGEMEADWVDVGVGIVQCGPYHCQSCGASEIGPEMKFEELVDKNGNYGGQGDLLNPEDFTAEEIKVGYYRNKISPYANTVEGEIVDHVTAKKAYNAGHLDEKNI